jgi:selenocysteine-specific elongation factor
MAAPPLVLGTAGHIDHGKSSLVKALTGTDPDRLAEEKQRGITIELGFARLDLPSGRALGIVDVPGHEKFVRQMVAGATGIDLVLLVVAADDGIMPQTREHLAIIDLLGIPAGVVAVTKSDLVDAEWTQLVEGEVAELLRGTSIEGAPIVAVSSRTGAGLEELKAALDEVAATAHATHAGLGMRLPVDRVFTIAGAGTVVTGTLWSGTIARDDQVQLYPSGRTARVRSVQVHSQAVDEAAAGQRAAVNLVGLEKDEVSRGDIVAAPGTLTVTDRFDARFTYLGWEGKTFETGARVHVHHGTREVLGRVLLMDGESMRPGETQLAQVRLEDPLAPRYEDRFIIRSYSPMFTIGGGVVLDALPPRRTRLKPHERELLGALESHDTPAAAVGLLAARGVPMTSAEVASALGVPRPEVADALNKAPLERLKVGADTYFVDGSSLEILVEHVGTCLLEWHDAHPKETGVAVPALRDLVDRRIAPKVFDAIVEVVASRGGVVIESGKVRHAAASAAALADEGVAVERLAELLAGQGLAPAVTAELAAEAGIEVGLARKALGKLATEGRVVRLGSDMHFDSHAVDEAKARIVAHLHGAGTITAGEARDVLGSSRKYVVPLLEYFDAVGVTKREGDARVLRSKR